MKIIKVLDLRFSEKEKEKEYMSIKKEKMGRDFTATMIILCLYLTSVIIETFIQGLYKSGIIAASALGALILLYLFRLLFKKIFLYILLIIIIVYNLSRLATLKSDYKNSLGVALFFAGYSTAVFLIILVSRIPYTSVRILVIVCCYLMRYSLLIFVINKGFWQAGNFIRRILLDLFILYYFYSSEKTERRVFMNFDQKREELLKFKELLVDFFPLGITIIDCNNLNPLSSIYGDEATLREIGSQKPELQTSQNNNYIFLLEVIQKILSDISLINKALCLTASSRDQGNPRSFNITLKQIIWNGKEAIAIVFNDITYQEKLLYWRMVNENKDKVIATVSHELRTPLNGIIGLLDMTEKKIEEPEALKFISLCRDNAYLLLSLVNSMLDLHQISANKLKLNISHINIRKCIQSVLHLFHFQTTQKGLYLTFSVQEDVPKIINTDENRLKQVIINFIGNAIKFTSEGGIKVIVANDETEPSFLKISVSDTGTGIKEEDKCKLFQMYGKLDDTRGMNKGGVGLGLTISNALAGILSGKQEEKEIQVTSVFGKGTTFSFNILKDLTSKLSICLENQAEPPHVGERKSMKQDSSCFERIETEEILLQKSLAELENHCIDELSFQCHDLSSKVQKYQTLEICSTAGSRNELEDNKYQIKRIRPIKMNKEETEISKENDLKMQITDTHIQAKAYILIVDDNPFNLMVAENLVKDTGYSVKTAMGGYEAIKQMEKFHQDGILVKVILMDCQMPVIDGYETTKILLEMMKAGKVSKVPIIAMTANNSNEDIEKCKRSGMVGHLTKPATKKELTELLKSKC